jgi:hypothetical protein
MTQQELLIPADASDQSRDTEDALQLPTASVMHEPPVAVSHTDNGEHTAPVETPAEVEVSFVSPLPLGHLAASKPQWMQQTQGADVAPVDTTQTMPVNALYDIRLSSILEDPAQHAVATAHLPAMAVPVVETAETPQLYEAVDVSQAIATVFDPAMTVFHEPVPLPENILDSYYINDRLHTLPGFLQGFGSNAADMRHPLFDLIHNYEEARNLVLLTAGRFRELQALAEERANNAWATIKEEQKLSNKCRDGVNLSASQPFERAEFSASVSSP